MGKKKKKKASKAVRTPKKPISITILIDGSPFVIINEFQKKGRNSSPLDEMTKVIKESFESPVHLKI